MHPILETHIILVVKAYPNGPLQASNVVKLFAQSQTNQQPDLESSGFNRRIQIM